MTPEFFGDLFEGGIQLAIAAWLTLLGFRVIGKKPGVSLKYDEWHAKFATLFKGGGLFLTLYGCFKFAPVLGVLAAPGFWSVPDSPYFPLQVGTSWVYENDHGKDQRIEVRVVGYERKGNLQCARLETWIDGRMDSWEHVRPLEDGLFRVAVKGARLVPPLRLHSLPNGPKDWRREIGGLALSSTQKDGVSIQVPAGTYSNALHVAGQVTDAKGTRAIEAWYVAGVGLVRMRQVLPEDRVIELSLKEFRRP